MGLFEKITTRYRYADGARMAVLHKYAVRFEFAGRWVDFGFEQALEPGIDRLIHADSMLNWNSLDGSEVAVSAGDKADLISRAEEYCRAKGFTFRII